MTTSRLERFSLGLLGRKRPGARLDERGRDELRRQMADCVAGKGGEVSARARAAALGRRYLELDEAGKSDFLALLASFDSDQAQVKAAAAAIEQAGTATPASRRALVPPYVSLLKQFNALPDGTRFLIDLRADLRRLMRERPELRSLEAELKDLLAAWFDVGFLELKRLDWQAPAAVLERLAEAEAVHAIADWDDLKNRLEGDRLIYVFFHPRLPDTPLIFVEVALLTGLPRAIGPLLDPAAPLIDVDRAKVAVFYSISNAQPGLAGISFGGFLIRQVVEALELEHPKLETFATLSPLPRFCDWLESRLAEGRAFSADEQRSLQDAGFELPALADELRQGAWADERKAQALKRPLERLALAYLLDKRPDGRAYDPVAQFHLGNGARVEQIDWLGDRSQKGFRQSAGLMVNYLYDLKEIDQNHESFSATGAVALSGSLKKAVKQLER